jgi:hypothetical protein
MARNILAVWNGELEAMREAAFLEARQFSWDRSMDALFGRVYPAALDLTAGHSVVPVGVSGSLVKA